MTLRRILLVGCVLGFVGGLVVSGRLSQTTPSVASPVDQAQSPARGAVPLPAAAALPDLSAVAERALLVSANIMSTTMQRVNNPFFEFFNGSPQFQRAQSLGSGVVVSADGYILTNTHVIGDGTAEVRVTLNDGRERSGRLVGIDDVTDLAVVKVDAQSLQTLPWGDSSKLRVAEWVMAIGNPFQLSGTVTLGIVSTVSRTGRQVGGYTDFIQTDAAINPGNSGGALVNARGELVGINTMIYTETGGNQGIGFAIPSNRARQIMEELIRSGSVAWGSIGPVRWVTMTPQLARNYRLQSDVGVLALPPARSQAARAGLLEGDIVVSFNGEKVDSAEQLDRMIKDSKIGAAVKLGVIRYDTGRPATIDLVITNRASQMRQVR